MKILLFGPENAGKTSLMRTTCLGYNFMKVVNLKPTKGISRENFIFRGLVELSVWDAGGQQRYLERYFSKSQRELIFSEVTTAIFMVDSTVIEDRIKEIFNMFLKYIFEYSPHVEMVYCLLNKIDLPNSKEDELYDFLIKDMDDDLKKKIAFTPVSVKEGSAQHRLIEILDHEIMKNTLSMAKMGKIQHFLHELKSTTIAEYLLFNQPDGLLIASTLGKFESEPLKFMSLKLSLPNSNIYQIYNKISKMIDLQPSSLTLSSILFESETSYIITKEISNGKVLLAVTKNKKLEVIMDVLKALANQNLKQLEEILEEQNLKEIL
ncbi:MAG: ADP-ribosylation factor-like protein [Promethearchaeota archaeon]